MKTHRLPIRFSGYFRKRLIACQIGWLCSAGLLLPQSAWSAESVQTASRYYHIPAGPLASALNQFVRQAGATLLFTPDQVQSLTTKGLDGRYSVAEGLAVLLKGSDLVAQSGVEGYTLERVSHAAGNFDRHDESVSQLPEVAVQARAEEETASTPVKGYVAKRGITATKTDTALLETPQSISVITRDELDMRNVQRDGDALRYTAGVFSENYGNDVRPTFDVGTIRGFDPSTTGMYRDGLRETNGLWSRMSTDIYNIERMEVLKGPSSVLYGQSEPAGVINKVTKKPTEVPMKQIDLQIGNYDRYQGGFDVGGPIDDDGKVLYRVVGLVRNSDSQYKYDNDHRSQDSRELLAPSLTIKPSEKTTLTLQAEYLHVKTGVPFTVGTATTTSNIMLGDYTYDKNERKQYSMGYLFEHVFNDAWTLRQNFRVNRVDFQYARMGMSGLSGSILSRSKSLIDEQLQGVAVDNQAQFKFNTGSIRHTALFGFDFQRSAYTVRDGDAVDNADVLDLSNPEYGKSIADPALTTKNRQALRQSGLYVQDQIKLDDHWVITLSGRKDWARADTANKIAQTAYDQNDTDFTYRTGLAYVFDNGLAPYISHSTSFNPAVGVAASGRALKPTTGKQNEVGIRYMPAGTSNIYTLSLFDLTQQNVTAYDAFFNAYQTGEIQSRGIEMEIKTRLAENLNMIAALTYSNVEITKTNGLGKKGDSPPYVPEKGASVWMDYKLASGWLSGVSVGGGVRYVGHSNGGDPFTPSYEYENESRTLFDAAINYRYNQHWQFAVNSNNLFNKQYTICAYGSCTQGYDRTVIASARYNF